MAADQAAAPAAAASVGTAEAVRLINREKAVLIDVSEPAEYAAGHAARRAQRAARPARGVAKDLPSNKALPLVLVCPTGARASRAVALLQQAGYENVHVAGRRPGGLARSQPAASRSRRPEHGCGPALQGHRAATIADCIAFDSPHEARPHVHHARSARTAMRAKALLKQRGVAAIDEVRVDLDPAQREHDDAS